ncbi:MAG TPA: JAB domain-containing protein [Thermoanaerobaculia bacterium]|nr:JAB domain-containing protein [Thermoanaerobaculia bacterium]
MRAQQGLGVFSSPSGGSEAVAQEQGRKTPRAGRPPGTAGAAAERGLSHLSDAELLAMLLAGRDRTPALVESTRQRLLDLGGLSRLAGIDRKELLRWQLDERQAETLLAAVELAARLARAVVPLGTPFARPREVVAYLWQRYGESRQEMVGAAWLDGRRRLICERVLVRGALEPLAVDPLPLLDEAIGRGAPGILLFHLRPPGDAGPSSEALALSRRLLERCEEKGLDFVDHLLIRSPAFWMSLRELW